MPRRRRQAKIPTLAWERPRGSIGARVLGRSFQFYGALVIGAVVVVALGVIAYALLDDYLQTRARPGSTAIQVEETRYRLDYLADRLTMFLNQSGGQADDVQQRLNALPTVANLLIGEYVAKRFAPEFEVAASEDEVKEEIAGRLGITADDESFDVVFQQELERSGISEKEYRLMAEATVLTNKLTEKFQQDLPKSAESVHYRQILVSTDEAAQEIQSQLEDGEDFATLARERSLDTATKEAGGDAGWLPKGVLDESTETLIFALAPGDITTLPVTQGVFVIEMLEKAKDRKIDDSQRQPLAVRVLSNWIEEKRQSLLIVNHVDVQGDGDPDKIRWAIDGDRA